ncbi:nuclear transport factor 2 family protein [Pseudomonas stutzeri]|uniref:Polyketide cyclase n=1 Tax=Stutzerimonas stutzeri TaxID=316 RepID=A0A2N8S672_STUST|nr:nuclear transport factor 2 family protein [Stutzerimonas stutzeri]MCQ4297613.1 nuclear transport factor 2 family protein [Stutzerimonas stutzeri]PNF82115.1 polyketide cyclase [Stutzerimonas stutzeri]
MSLQLPDVVETYFDISNGGDLSQLASCFCTDATVFDENKTHDGLAAIEAWQHEVRQAFAFEVEPLQALQGEGKLTVNTRLTGNFTGSPVQLNQVFRLENGRILSLEIIPC